MELYKKSIKKENVKLVLNQDDISSGMLKTFWYLVEIYLSPRNSLILIDKFENSLGVNCLDSITGYQLKAGHLMG